MSTADREALLREWTLCRQAWKSPIPTTSVLAQYDALVEKLMAALSAVQQPAQPELASGWLYDFWNAIDALEKAVEWLPGLASINDPAERAEVEFIGNALKAAKKHLKERP